MYQYRTLPHQAVYKLVVGASFMLYAAHASAVDGVMMTVNACSGRVVPPWPYYCEAERQYNLPINDVSYQKSASTTATGGNATTTHSRARASLKVNGVRPTISILNEADAASPEQYLHSLYSNPLGQTTAQVTDTFYIHSPTVRDGVSVRVYLQPISVTTQQKKHAKGVIREGDVHGQVNFRYQIGDKKYGYKEYTYTMSGWNGGKWTYNETFGCYDDEAYIDMPLGTAVPILFIGWGSVGATGEQNYDAPVSSDVKAQGTGVYIGFSHIRNNQTLEPITDYNTISASLVDWGVKGETCLDN